MPTNNPLVSVIMSIYSEPIEWIQQSINSILLQTFKDFEFIIINDNPTKNDIKKILINYQRQDNRIIIVENKNNIGLTKSLNKGLNIAKGKYIARMDADDISNPIRLEKQVHFMENNPNVIVCGTNIKYIGEVPPMTYSDWIKYQNDDIKAQMLFNSGFAHPTVMIRHSILRQNHIQYDENFRQGQDYRLWELLYSLGDFANLPDKLLSYRLSKQQISKKANSNQVNNGVLIRRSIIKEWLKSKKITTDLNLVNTDTLKEIKSIINNRDQPYYNSLIRTYYFSRSNKKNSYFIQSIISGNFFRLSAYNKLRYILILLNLKKTIIW